MTAIMGQISSVLAALAFAVYIWSILKPDGSRPSRMTWFLLASIGWIVAISSYYGGATDTLWPLVINAAGSTITAILAIKRGDGGWTRVDQVALIGVAATVMFAALTRNAFASLIAALVVDFIALLPTLAKLARRPQTEEALPWVLIVLSNLFNALAVDWFAGRLTTETAVAPLYFLAANGLIVGLTLRPEKPR